MRTLFVWFDLGLTLADNNHCELYQEALIENHMTVERYNIGKIKRAYHLANKYFMRAKPGELGKRGRNPAEFLNVMLDYLGVVSSDSPEGSTKRKSILDSIAKRRGRIRWKAFPFSKRVLEELHEMGIETGLISNWDTTCRGILRETGLLPHLNPIVISCEVGFQKPDQRIFETALNKAGKEARDCLYVGDNYYDDVIGASKVGMRSLLINPKNRLGIEEISYPYVIESIKEVKEYV